MANTATLPSKEISTLSGQETAGQQAPVVNSSGEITNFRTPGSPEITDAQSLSSIRNWLKRMGEITPKPDMTQALGIPTAI